MPGLRRRPARENGHGESLRQSTMRKTAPHYLREGRIFVFDVPLQNLVGDGKRSRRIEHYWLCGACLQTMLLERSNRRNSPDPETGNGFRSEVAAS